MSHEGLQPQIREVSAEGHDPAWIDALTTVLPNPFGESRYGPKFNYHQTIQFAWPNDNSPDQCRLHVTRSEPPSPGFQKTSPYFYVNFYVTSPEGSILKLGDVSQTHSPYNRFIPDPETGKVIFLRDKEGKLDAYLELSRGGEFRTAEGPEKIPEDIKRLAEAAKLAGITFEI